MFPHKRTPLRLFAVASLLLTFAGQVSAGGGCKPVVDKGRMVVELAVAGTNGANRVSLDVPMNAKQELSGGEGAPDYAHGRTAGGFTYSVRLAERRGDGALIELNVMVRNPNGSIHTVRRSVYVAHQQVVEQVYLGGVSLKAYFPMKPFHCKKA